MKKKLLSYFSTLRFPVLLIVTFVLFIADLFIPDVIPFVDEFLLGLIALILSRLKRPGKTKAVSTDESAEQ